MAIVVAFLRAINVGGRFIKMAQLRSHFEALSLRDVSTYINSGNVLLSTSVKSLTKLEASIEGRLEPLLGFKAEVFLRSEQEVHEVAAAAVEHRRSVPQSGEVNVAFIAKPLNQSQTAALYALRTDLDDFAHDERQVYWLCKGRQTESKFSNAVLERRLQLRCTFRRVSMLEELSRQLEAASDA